MQGPPITAMGIKLAVSRHPAKNSQHAAGARSKVLNTVWPYNWQELV